MEDLFLKCCKSKDWLAPEEGIHAVETYYMVPTALYPECL